MGEVWRGEHAHSGLPVALKLIRPDRVGDAEDRWGFEREIRMQARLDHPSIVYLYDHGQLESEAAAVVGTDAGGPWLAMEYCSGTLMDIAGGLDWVGTRSVLLQLLDALAHAHAVGVLHRDIKIANVLVSEPSDVRPGIKLADFGIAHALSDPDETTRSVGTPRYMAPEQVVGEWEDHGPWTDLYALGVLAWRLITGRRPYRDLNGAKLAMAMLSRPLGWPGARFGVPKEVERWIERMTAKSPLDRFQLAADASEALKALPDSPGRGAWVSSTTRTLIPQFEEVPSPRAPVLEPMDDPPPESEANIRMHAAGLGLLALRRPALIGRRTERAMAWALLRRAARRGLPEVLCVLGPPRVGRTRFLEWFGEAAQRSGQGLSVTVRCVPGRDFGDQVVAALRQWFRIGDRSLIEAIEHLESWVGEGPWLRDTAAMLVRGEAGDAGWPTTLAGALGGLARRRPVVLRLEGAGGIAGVERFVAAICQLERAPLVVALDRRVEGAEVLELGPMSAGSMHRLAEAMVSLDPTVRERVVRRASGSPGFLVQMLIHWASRFQLQAGPEGFVVAEAERGMPPTLAVVGSIRLDAVLAAITEQGRRSLARAAVIGVVVDVSLWAEVDADGSPFAREAVLSALMDRGLAADHLDGWRFSSAPFREAVLARSSTLAQDHLRCADVIEARGRPSDALSLGRHRLESGDVVGSLEPLAQGCQWVAEREGTGDAAVADLRRAVEQLSGPMLLRWRAVLDQISARFLVNACKLGAAAELAERALRTAELLGDAVLSARCWAVLGAVAAARHDHQGREEAYGRALESGLEVPAHLRASWWVELAKSHLARDEREQWKDCMAEAGRCAAGFGGVEHLVPLGRAIEAQVAGRVDDALRFLDTAYAHAEGAGAGRGRLAVLRSRAHTLLEAGRLEPAHVAFTEALELAVSLRDDRAPVVLANTIALDLRMGRSGSAADRFERYRFLLPPGRDRGPERVPLHCAGAAAGAIREDWRRVQYHLERVVEHGVWSPADVERNQLCLGFAAERAGGARRALSDSLIRACRELGGAV